MVPAREMKSYRFEVQVRQLASGLSARAQGKIMPEAFCRAMATFDERTRDLGLWQSAKDMFDGCRDRLVRDHGCHRFHMEDGRAQVTIIRLVRQ